MNPVAIQSPGQFAKAIRNAQPGDTVIIADGDYKNWTASLDSNGTENQPITVKPQSTHGVRFSGVSSLSITGKYIEVSGFVFENCTMDEMSLVEFDGAENCLLSNSIFQHCSGSRPAVSILAGTKENEIAQCRFLDIAGRSVQVKVNDDIYQRGIPTGNIIRNNSFQDIPPLNGNGRETVKLGQNQPTYGHIKTYTLVEGNTFIRVNGEAEIISNKCSSNTFRANTFIDCEGELVMRGGSHCLIESNRFVGCKGGIRLSGTHHTVKDNVILDSQGTGIRLLYGMTAQQGGHYQAVSECLITNNLIINADRAGIFIGDGRNKDWGEKGFQGIAPFKNQFTNNIIRGTKDTLLLSDHAPDNLREGNQLNP